MAVTSRQELVDYCMRRLGAPVIEINVDEDQVSDRIDEALQYYQEYHSDAIIKNYRKHQVTQQDIDNRYIDVPSTMLYIQKVFPSSSGGQSGGALFNIEYHMRMEDLLLLGANINLADYVHRKQYLSLVNMTLDGHDQIRFNRHMNRVFIDDDWEKKFPVGSWIIVEGHEVVDPNTFTDVYNDRLLKKYATALIKQQWGQNVLKYEGMTLPGGIIFNGRQIYDDATAEIEQIEEQMQETYEMPADFMVG